MPPTIVQKLIEKGLDINAKNRDGKTALQHIFEYALEYAPFDSENGKQMRERIKMFVDRGADMSWFDPDKAKGRDFYYEGKLEYRPYYYDVTSYFKLMNKLLKKRS